MRIKCFCIVLCGLYALSDVAAQGTFTFPIGGLFNPETIHDSLLAYRNMVTARKGMAYTGEPMKLMVTDSYSTALDICSRTSTNDSGVMAIIDPRPTDGICDTTCQLCNKLSICHLSTSWKLPPTLASDLFSFSYHPSHEHISKAYATLINHLKWDKFTILYENDDSFLRVQEIINTWPHDAPQILYRKLDPDSDNRETFKDVFKVARMSHHVIDCELKNIEKYINEIVAVEESTVYQSFILTNLDAYTFNFSKVPKLMSNVSTLHLTVPQEARWSDFQMDPSNILLDTALTADALDHLERSILVMQNTTEWRDQNITPSTIPSPPPLCFASQSAEYKEKAWPLGEHLRQALIKTSLHGFTGHVEFDEDGKRTKFRLHYSKLNIQNELVHAGYWESTLDKIIEEKNVMDRSGANSDDNIIKVAVRIEDPYCQEGPIENGEQTYEGYSPDLVEKIFKYMEENLNDKRAYKIYKVADNDNGNPIAGTNKWTGLVGEVIEHNADLAVGDLTITSERSSVIDFSTPFMSLGISMLKKEPPIDPPRMFSFLEPLSFEVWMYLSIVYVVVSFILLISARMSQGDWVNPHPCNQNPENLQNIWTFYNCMWLTMGSIMTQGCDILPRAAGSRWITGIWWFFALIITSSYTANMSTVLSEGRRSNDIKSIKELASQTKVSYGTVINSSTYKFFKNSNDTTFSKIWEVMQSTKPTVFTNKNSEGVERVNSSKGNYIFFMESTWIEYHTKRKCDLQQFGGNLDSKEYGIALPKNSVLKHSIDVAILSLQEKGELDALKKKWWEKNAVECPEPEKESNSLGIESVSGLFLMLGVGGLVGLVVAIVDFLLNAHDIAVKERVTYRDAIISELKVSLNPRQLHKPAAPPRSIANSSSRSQSPAEEPRSRAVSVLRAATSLINFDDIY